MEHWASTHPMQPLEVPGYSMEVMEILEVAYSNQEVPDLKWK
jgi:hypothetical protein